jgi:plastocyanin
MTLLLVCSVAAAALVACGGDEDVESEGGEGGSDSTPEYVVVAKDFEYSVADLEVQAGEFVLELNNQGSAPHTFSIYRDADYSDLAETTGQVNGGVDQRFDMSLESGTYFVHCDVHPTQMKATVVAK